MLGAEVCDLQVPSDRSPSPVTWGSLEVLPLNEALYPSLDNHRVRQEPTLQLRGHLHWRGRDKEEWGGVGRDGEEWEGVGRGGEGRGGMGREGTRLLNAMLEKLK